MDRKKLIFLLVLAVAVFFAYRADFSSLGVSACNPMCDDGCGCRSLGQACGEGSASCRMVGGCVDGRCVANQACGCGGCGSDADCGGGGGGGGDGGGGGGGCDENNWGGWSACSASCGGGTQTRTNDCGTTQSQACNSQACPTPTPTPVTVPVMGVKVGNLDSAISEAMSFSWQDLQPVNIRSRAMTSQITYMGVLFSDGFSLNTNSVNFNAEKATMETKSSSQKSLIQNIISSLFSLLNPFSF